MWKRTILLRIAPVCQELGPITSIQSLYNGRFLWPTAWSQCGFQSQSNCNLLNPTRVAVWAAPLNTMFDAIEDGFVHGCTKLFVPIRWKGDWRHGKGWPFIVFAYIPADIARPLPIFQFSDQAAPHWMQFDKAKYLHQLCIVLHWKRTKAARVKSTRSRPARLRMPTRRMRCRQPSHKARQVTISARCEDQMPMLWQNTISQQPGLESFDGLRKRCFEFLIVIVGAEDRLGL